jgi:hypothetical protein
LTRYDCRVAVTGVAVVVRTLEVTVVAEDVWVTGVVSTALDALSSASATTSGADEV